MQDALPLANFQKSADSMRPDVLIIGGGVVGCSVAYHLTARGCRNVLVLERNTVGSGSTGKAAGGIRQQFSHAANIQLSMYAVDFFTHFHERLGLEADEGGVEFHQVGYLFLLSTDEELAQFRQSANLQRSFGLPVEVLTATQLAERYPWLNAEGLLGATYCPTDGYGSPHEVNQAFAKVARRQGARILEGTTVQAIKREGAHIVSVETDKGSISPGTVVCCAGAWSAELGRMLGIEIPISPLRRMCFMTDPFEALPHDAPMTIEVSNTFHFRPEGPGFMLGASDQQEPFGFKTEVNWQWLDTVVEDAVRRVPAFEQARIQGGWAGLYETTPDDNAIIGAVPGLENFLIAAGFSGHGFMQSPATGLVISELILDGKAHTIPIEALSIERFASGSLLPERNII
ncbi:NAD(P)/FAD-dependent oxidoreductase [Ktedonosporobacter rubrisoli]|nr:FAD-binding oxidoreductase [Ktedonosporobacter rubrisoli]